jgi:hypothetical protein
MLTTVIIINYLFSMNNCVLKASESYKNLKKIPYEVMWVFTLHFKCRGVESATV